jgi:hypothetical protein
MSAESYVHWLWDQQSRGVLAKRTQGRRKLRALSWPNEPEPMQPEAVACTRSMMPTCGHGMEAARQPPPVLAMEQRGGLVQNVNLELLP